METTKAAPAPMSASDERTWALLAHLSILLNLLTVILGPVVALIIYFIFKDRSRSVAYHSLQSFLFQMVFWVGAGALAVVLGALVSALFWLIIPLLCLPVLCLLGLVPFGALVYGVIGAVETSQGKPFDYWLVGNWANNILGEATNEHQVVVYKEEPREETGPGEM
ncbi:MAG TPA: DUF4870 domain-containing protein [Anaerolineales bacterium]|nr:DUF4870 domain-containing protein [Anaerolineales bacterium]